MRIENEISHAGFFWIPGNEENQVPGILKIVNGGEIRIEITSEEDLSESDIHIERILGRVEKLGFVILENCFYWIKSGSFGLGQISTSIIHARYAYIGTTTDDSEPIKFSEFTFDIELLNEWLIITGIKIDPDYENRTCTISYEPLTPMEFQTNEASISIAFRHSLPIPGKITEAAITHSAFFKIKSKEPKTVDFYTLMARKIASFFCIATDQTVTIKEVGAIIPASETDQNEDIKVRMYYKSLPFSDSPPKPSARHDCIFTYPHVSEQFEEILIKWIEEYDLIYPALNLYIATRDGTHKYLENKLLSLSQALETFSRRTNSKKNMDQGEFEKLCGTLLNSCPQQHKKWLEGRITHGNELSLSNRLKALFLPFMPTLKDLNPQSKTAVRKIVDSRNYLTHLDPASKAKCAKPLEMAGLTQIMEAVFILTLLRHIGLSEEAINQATKSWPIRRRFMPI